jgi:hypothetical protein
MAECLMTLLSLCILCLPGKAENGRTESSSDTSVGVASRQSVSQRIVIGFLGGFVAHDEPHHPEVRVVQALRAEYPSEAYFGLFENKKITDALNVILRRLDVNHDGRLTDDEKRRACIELFGHSWGASAVVSLSRRLEHQGIPVRLTVQVDSVAKPFHNDSVIPANVLQAANFYQRKGLVRGEQRIVAADPSRTTILGNFRLEYKNEPQECRAFPWYARFFTKSHIEIECDPKVWSQVEILLRGPLSAAATDQTDSIADLASSRSRQHSTKETKLSRADPMLAPNP